MATRSVTDWSDIQQARNWQKSDQQQVELALQQKIKAEHQKQEHVKQQQNKDRKKEEDERKQREDKERRTASMTATTTDTQAVSPDAPVD
jgi:hypothetical protein